MPDDKITPEPVRVTINDDAKRKVGRPPGSRTKPTVPNSQKPTTQTADVKQALATLDSAYTMVAMGLMTFGLPQTANEWVERSEALRATNAEALASAPKLAKMIAGAGTTGGTAAFIMAHTIALGSVAMIARQEFAMKQAERQPRQAAEPRRPMPDDIPGAPLPDPSNDPTLIPGVPLPGVSNVRANG